MRDITCGRLLFEDLVHHLGAAAEHGAQLTAVNDLSGPGRAVTDQARDLLGRYAVMGHQRDEAAPQLARRPLSSDPRSLADIPKHPPNIPGTHAGPGAGGEHEP